MAEAAVEGFEVTLHRALTTPPQWCGAPRLWTVIVLTLGMVLILIWHQWKMGVPLALGLQGLGILLTKHDPSWPQVLWRHLHTKPFYYS